MKDTKNMNLRKRLDHIWEYPDFFPFFAKYTKRPSFFVKKGGGILYEGDEPRKIYFVKKGFVKLFRTSPEGRSTIIYLYGPGSILAIRALTTQEKKLRHGAEAMTDVEVVTISEDDYFNALAENPEYVVDLLHVFIERLNYTERKLEGFILTDTTARVANFLYDLTERFGEKKKDTVELPLPLTHQTISDFVGAFRETVTLAMNRLKKEGVLKDERGKITILDIKKLKQQALI